MKNLSNYCSNMEHIYNSNRLSFYTFLACLYFDNFFSDIFFNILTNEKANVLKSYILFICTIFFLYALIYKRSGVFFIPCFIFVANNFLVSFFEISDVVLKNQACYDRKFVCMLLIRCSALVSYLYQMHLGFKCLGLHYLLTKSVLYDSFPGSLETLV